MKKNSPLPLSLPALPEILPVDECLLGFHKILGHWFQHKFATPTPAQKQGWPSLKQGCNTLIAAPTGGGKTLAAFFVAIDDLFCQAIENNLEAGIQVLYISPLRALSNDVKKNLEQPLLEIMTLTKELGLAPEPIRIGLRTGDSTASQRASILRKPPHILVTTPESLFIMLSSSKARMLLTKVRTVIIDEIHALARDKRGTHLSLSLEHLSTLCKVPPVRIGLSATQKPLTSMAHFLVGGTLGSRPCAIVDVSQQREAGLDLVIPDAPLGAICSLAMWTDLYSKLAGLIESHRSTLIFVNTRRMAERITFQLSELLGEEAVAAHHGSLSKIKRLEAEDLLKTGQIKAIVATSSLELGIDVGTIDLVCQIGSPRSIAGFVQRVGRSGHALGLQPKARLFAMTRDELIDCLALLRAYREGTMDSIEIPLQPFDILAQHIISLVACEPRKPDAVFDLCRNAFPYTELDRKDFDKILQWLDEGLSLGTRRGAYLHWDKLNDELRPRRHARLAVLMSGGAIPEQNQYRVINSEDQSIVGTVDEEFAIESSKGDVFLLGNTSWQINGLKGDTLFVQDREGAPPTIPFWKGEAGGRTFELSAELSRLRTEADAILSSNETPSWTGALPSQDHSIWQAYRQPLLDFLLATFLIDPFAAEQAADFLATQKIALGLLPTQNKIVYERFFDETGGMQLIVHAPFGSRINKAWGLSFRKRFCRGFDFELQASATDNGILLSVGPNQSFPLEALFKMLNPSNGRSILIQALLEVPMFEIRWRWNVNRALAVLRMRNGKRVPPHLQRYQSNDLLTAVFPQQTQCFEHRTGDLEVPDHPLVRQTVQDCLQEAMDCVRFERILQEIASGTVTLFARDTREPSPFCYELIHANPYAFLDDAPLEERRIRALSTRHRLVPQVFNDLTALDPGAIAKVVREAWPLIRDGDELYDALKQLIIWPHSELASYQQALQGLERQGRIKHLQINRQLFAYVLENEPLLQTLYPEIFQLVAPDMAAEEAAFSKLLRGQLECLGPQSAEALSQRLKLPPAAVLACLQILENQGILLSGQFTGLETQKEWCERRLLQRMHRITIEGLRENIRPVPIQQFLRFLAKHQHCGPEHSLATDADLMPLIEQLEGLELSAGVWENEVLSTRIKGFHGSRLDSLCQSGQVVWGRISIAPPKIVKTNKNRLFSRSTPLSFLARASLSWIVPTERPDVLACISEAAKQIWQHFEQSGALFFDELASLCRLLPSQLEDALSELISLGLINSDSFAGMRPLINPDRRPRSGSKPSAPTRHIRYSADFRRGGRYAVFGKHRTPCERELLLENWAWLLLKRYGLVCRDLLHKETLAPSWGELAIVYRRLEARGLIRGGRFVDKVGGEQFALKESIDALRACKDSPADTDFIILAAADPLNWMGILTADPKLAAKTQNRVAFCAGRYVAYREGGACIFIDESLTLDQRAQVERGLRLSGLYRGRDPFLQGPVTTRSVEADLERDAKTKPDLRNWQRYKGLELHE